MQLEERCPVPGEPTLRIVTGDDLPSPDALLEQVARGDLDAFDQFYDLVSPAVFGTARRVVRDPARAEEVAQEVFLDVWRQATRFDRRRGGARTWVLTMAHRRAVDVVRSSEAARARERKLSQQELDVVAGPEEHVVEQDERRAVRRCLQALTALQLESVTLAYYQGYTYPQVAALLKQPLPTIKTRMRDGLIRLRDCMGGRS
ncbi:ECF RNA polymerase sigma factor SigK [Skermania piniformis]|uniref:ECF RNA polymerase sigma factor SigK n=1 Tax=Skermania pinensis TaxID=39122 RepID=A0ABX8SB93_9ACTN|nr:ECF RNA polymerase sigma factor SigK [Skermania piniformis]